MQDFLIELINTYGYLGIGLLIFVENIFPPIPSELVLVFGGFMTTHTNMNVFGVAFAASVGSLFGALLLYYIGKALKKERLKKLCAGKVGKLLHINAEHIEKADRFFVRYEHKAVLLCRCIPIVRSLISIPAGISEMNLSSFLILTFLGSAVWNTILSIAGSLCGEAWEQGMIYIEWILKAVILLVVIIVAIWFFVKRKKGRK